MLTSIVCMCLPKFFSSKITSVCVFFIGPLSIFNYWTVLLFFQFFSCLQRIYSFILPIFCLYFPEILTGIYLFPPKDLTNLHKVGFNILSLCFCYVRIFRAYCARIPGFLGWQIVFHVVSFVLILASRYLGLV